MCGGGLMVYAKAMLNITHLRDVKLRCEDLEYKWICLDLKDTRKTLTANI